MYLNSAKKHVIAALVLPGLVMILEAGALLRDQFTKYRALENSRDYAYITSQAGYIASFILPQEGSATTAYQLNGSEYTFQEMDEARRETDRALADILEMLAKKAVNRADMVMAIQEIWAATESLKQFRQEADTGNLLAEVVASEIKPFSLNFIQLVSLLRFEMRTPEATRQINLFLDALDANEAALQIGAYSDKYLRGRELSLSDTRALAGVSAIFAENVQKIRTYPETRQIGSVLAFQDTDQGKWLGDVTNRIQNQVVQPSARLLERWRETKEEQFQALRRDLDLSGREIRSIGDAIAAEARLQFNIVLFASVTLVGAVIAVLLLAAKSVRFIDHLMREREQLIGELQSAAHTDLLTGLLNRRGFDAALVLRAKARRLKGASAVVIFDLDKFKHINDSYGHDVGDIVLQKAAEIAKAHFRPDDLLARHGGEEFVAFLPNLSPENAADLADRVRQALERSEIRLESGNILQITASFGCAQVDHDVSRSTVNGALKRADKALYAAKFAGRNRVVNEADIEQLAAMTKPAA